MIRPLVRIALALPLVAIGAGAASGVASQGPAAPLCAQAAASHRVGLVVEHANGQVIRRCVGFNSATATALGVLQSSGLEVGISSYGGGLGAAICQIDNEPLTYPPGCFTASGSYWVLFVSRAGSAWATSAVGASNVTVANGDDVGFRYDSQSGADPPPPSPAGTCPVLTPPPATTPTPAVRPTLRPATSTASPAASTSRPASQPPAGTPTADVLGIATPGATPAVTGALTQSSLHTGVNIGLLLAAIGAGALVGLLGTQVLRRRRE